MTAIVGNDGAITMPTERAGIINRWRAVFNYVVSETTGFGDTLSRRNRLGMVGIEGSASGIPEKDVATSTPVDPANDTTTAAGASLVLTVAAGCTYTFTAAFQRISHDVNKIGDNTLAFDFVNGDTADIAVVWDET